MTLLSDLRFAVRLLLKERSFTVTALLTLIVCLGANTAIFGLVRSVLLKPLPFPDADQLVSVYKSYPRSGALRMGSSVPDYLDRQRDVPALAEQGLYRRTSLTVGDENGVERLEAVIATPSLYRTLRVAPGHGHAFVDADGEPGQNTKVLISARLWRRAYGASPSVLGQVLRLNGTSFVIVGVMPDTFTFLSDDIDLFLPSAFQPAERSDNQRHTNSWQMIGRLAPGATLAQAQQQIAAIDEKNIELYPQFKALVTTSGFHTQAVLLQDDVVRDVKTVLLVLWGGVVFVLVVGCVNIGNLVMIRAASRAREMATRQAIGADRRRLARQVLTETVLLSATGGAGGVLLGVWLLGVIRTVGLEQLPRGHEVGVDVWTALAILAGTIVVGVLIGLAPMTALWRMNLVEELRDGGRAATNGRRARLWRQGLATAQVSIAFVLLIGAGLLFASFREVLQLDMGFEPSGVLTGAVSVPASTYADGAAVLGFTRRTLDRLGASTALESVALTSAVPFSGNIPRATIFAEGAVLPEDAAPSVPTVMIASPKYFDTMGMTLVRGRDFDERDAQPGAPLVTVLDQQLAERFWPGQDAVGRRLYRPGGGSTLRAPAPTAQFITVIGVVRTAQLVDPRADFTPVGAYYLPLAQAPQRTLTIVARARGDQSSAITAIRREVATVDPLLPVFRIRSMSEWVGLALLTRRLFMWIAVGFGLTGALLSAIGIYGVLAYGVSQRAREFGVRMALGGTPHGVTRLVLADGFRIVVPGALVGLAAALFAGPLLESQLYRIAPVDTRVFAGVALGLSAVALVACLIPAWRARRINLMVVLGK